MSRGVIGEGHTAQNPTSAKYDTSCILGDIFFFVFLTRKPVRNTFLKFLFWMNVNLERRLLRTKAKMNDCVPVLVLFFSISEEPPFSF